MAERTELKGRVAKIEEKEAEYKGEKTVRTVVTLKLGNGKFASGTLPTALVGHTNKGDVIELEVQWVDKGDGSPEDPLQYGYPKPFGNTKLIADNKAASAPEVKKSDGNSDKIYLNVPREEKDDAKALGARWDPEAKKWWATKENIDKLKKWHNTNNHSSNEPETSEFADVPALEGGKFKGKIVSLKVQHNAKFDKDMIRVLFLDDRNFKLFGEVFTNSPFKDLTAGDKVKFTANSKPGKDKGFGFFSYVKDIEKL